MLFGGSKNRDAESRSQVKNKPVFLVALGVTPEVRNVRFWGYGLPINEGQILAFSR